MVIQKHFALQEERTCIVHIYLLQLSEIPVFEIIGMVNVLWHESF